MSRWLGNMLLRAPASVRSMRKVPVLGDFLHRVARRALPNDERVWTKAESGPSEGLWFELNPRTGQTYLRGDAELTVQNVLAGKLRPGTVFYDLGANIGLFSMIAARVIGPTGRVFSFEPDPEAAERLNRNLARNELRNVTVVSKGVWSTTGKRPFAPADASSPDHGTGKFVAGGGLINHISLECVALDDFIANAPAPDAVKCDVEGAEVEVLRGAQRILQRYRPWILIELHSEATAISVRDILNTFGYKIDRVDEGHVLAQPCVVN